VDANILYSRTLRDWVLQLSLSAGMFHCYGTEHIYAEVAYHLQRDFPDLDGVVFSRFREKFDTCLTRIDSYRALDDYPGNDPNDQQVHSAATYLMTSSSSWTTQRLHWFTRSRGAKSTIRSRSTASATSSTGSR